MGFEERNGRLYYYEKRREGGRVVSEYVGNGLSAQLAEFAADERALERRLKHERLAEKRNEFAELNAEVDRLCDWVEALSKSEFLALGYYQHKGQWRKRRNEKDR
jgi:hypothetical protein